MGTVWLTPWNTYSNNNPDNGAVSAKRYYTFAGQTVAVRTGTMFDTVTSVFNDPHGTGVIQIGNGSNRVVRRYLDPFGASRDSAAGLPAGTGGGDGSWVGDHGFLDKPEDSSGLTAVGARLYDAVLGAFISVDPVMDLADPQQWNAYVYANNNPMTFSDPTGLLLGPLIDGAYTAPTRGKPGSGGWQVGPNNTGYTGSWNNGGAGKWARPGTTYTPPVTIRRDPAADEARAQAAAAAKAKAQAEARARAAAEQRAREHAAAEAAHKKQAGIGQQVGGWLSGFGDAVGNVAEAAWDWSGQAAEQLTESKIGKSIEFACGFAFGAVATLCGAVYTAAYARQGKWDKAAVSAVGMIGGGAAGNAVAKNVVKRFANDLPGTPALSDARSISAVGDTLGVSDARRLYGMSYATSNVAGTATTLALSSAGNGIIGQD